MKRRIQLPENAIHILAVLSVLPAWFSQVRLVNAFGEVGSAFYFVAFDFVFLLFSLTGLGLFGAVSDMVFSRVERADLGGASRVARSAAWNGFLISVPVCLLGYMAASFVMRNVFQLPLAELAAKGLLPALAPLSAVFALCGAMDGFGYRRGTDTVRLTFGLVLFLTALLFTAPLYEYGEKVGALLQNEQYGPAYGAQGAALSWAAAALAALIAALFCKRNMNRELKKTGAVQNGAYREKEKKLFGNIYRRALSAAAPFLLLSLVMGGQALVFFGVLKQDALQWGVFAGKSGLLLFLPVFWAACYALHMLPDLRAAYLSRNLKRSRERFMVSLRCVALMMVPLAVILAVMGEAFVGLFFPEGEVVLAGQLLRIGSICIVFYGVAAMLGAILLSMDMTLQFILATLLPAALHLGALYGMLKLLDVGIFGVVYANLILSFLLCCCYLYEIRRQVRIRISWLRIFLAPCVAGAAMAGVCALFSLLILREAPVLLNVAVGTAAGAAVYFAAVLLLKGAGVRELKSYPGGEVLVALARMTRLL